MFLTRSFISFTSPIFLLSGMSSPSSYKVPNEASCLISRAVGFVSYIRLGDIFSTSCAITPN